MASGAYLGERQDRNKERKLEIKKKNGNKEKKWKYV
jgi:hypothetical protein